MTIWWKIVAISAVFIAQAPASMADPRAETVVRDAAASAFVGLADHVDAAPVLDVVDVERVGRFVLGRHIRSATPDALNRYQTEFNRYLEAVYAQQLSRFAGASFAVTGSVDRKPGDSVVKSLLTLPNGDRLDVDWRMLERDGRWRIVDVSAYDVWLVLEQRAQFDAILSRPRADLDTLTATLKTRTEQALSDTSGAAQWAATP